MNFFHAPGILAPLSKSSPIITWTAQPSMAANNAGSSFNAIAFNGSVYIAVGSAGACATSPDAITWTKRTSLSAVTANTIYSIASNGSRFVVVGVSGTAAYSDDNGLTWTLLTGVFVTHTNGITWDGSQFIAVGNGNQVFTSPTGISWTDKSAGIVPFVTSSLSLTAIAGDGSHYITGGIMQTAPSVAIVSSDLTTWSGSAANFSAAFGSIGGLTGVRAVMYSGGQYFAVGNSGCCASSFDGITWQALPTLKAIAGTARLAAIAGTGSLYVCTGTAGVCAASLDGTNWYTQPTFSTAMSAVVGSACMWNGSQFIAVGGQYCVTGILTGTVPV